MDTFFKGFSSLQSISRPHVLYCYYCSLDLLDDSSVEAVEQVIGSVSDDDFDLEPNKVEANPVSPSVSSMSLAETQIMANRQEMVTSPQPEDFSIHNTIGTSSISGRELSPTSVACMMDIKDFEQKTSTYVDALDWLMDVGVHQLPASTGEEEPEWSNGHAVTTTTLALPVAPRLTPNKISQLNTSAMSVLDGEVF